MVFVMTVIAVVCRNMMGNGDGWFIVGTCAAVSTLGYESVMAVLVLGLVPVFMTHVVCCVRRPGLPFPRRLFWFVKQKGDRFCVGADGMLVPPDQHGVVVRPGLPMITYLVVAALIVGAVQVLAL